MPSYAILEAPSILGLRPTGVEDLPLALANAGLADRLRAKPAGRVDPPPYSAERDPDTHILNPGALRDYSIRLADAVGAILDRGAFPVVLGGDCSILLGNLLALRRRGRYGLLFLDGHADFYQPEASSTGEAADMDLGLVSGRGPDLLANMEDRKPLVRDVDVVVFGFRDARQAAAQGSRSVAETAMHVMDLDHVRTHGAAAAAREAVGVLSRRDLAGFWIHLDADVLDDAVMPAVDYRMPDGLSFAELTATLRAAMGSRRAVGLNVTIFNPRLDADGAIARNFTTSIVEGLT